MDISTLVKRFEPLPKHQMNMKLGQ
ncbi:hypothetical protein CCACVL1_01119, partial [Corchorus capsularis]